MPQIQLNHSEEYLSQVELAILRSTVPFELEEFEEITVMGQKGKTHPLLFKRSLFWLL
jgi:hypothetical protein